MTQLSWDDTVLLEIVTCIFLSLDVATRYALDQELLMAKDGIFFFYNVWIIIKF